MEEHQHTEIKQPKAPNKDDFALSGIFFTFGLIAIIGVLVYFLTIQTNAAKCEPEFDEHGSITNNCPPKSPTPVPNSTLPGQIELVPGLQKNNKIPGLDTP